MQIYSKSMKNATSLFSNHNRSALPAGTYITHRVIYYPLVSNSNHDRPPSDGSTSIHIVHLPLVARTEAVSLRFHQDLAMDAHSFSGCWALDNVIVTNMAHRPTSLQETFDPIDPTSWLFFPNGAIRVGPMASASYLHITFTFDHLTMHFYKKNYDGFISHIINSLHDPQVWIRFIPMFSKILY